jgi:hypothetical protein
MSPIPADPPRCRFLHDGRDGLGRKLAVADEVESGRGHRPTRATVRDASPKGARAHDPFDGDSNLRDLPSWHPNSFSGFVTHGHKSPIAAPVAKRRARAGRKQFSM